MLKNKISLFTARKWLVIISLIGLFYHFLVITQIVDYKYAWGGRLQNINQMYQFEAGSVVVQLFLFTLIIISAKFKPNDKVSRLFKILFYLLAIIFLLNTFGNLVAFSLFEKILFTPLTLLSSIFAWRLAVE